MKNWMTAGARRTRHGMLTALVTAAALALTVAPPRAASTEQLAPPAVPTNLRVPDGHDAFLMTHAVGTQAYICLALGSKAEWTFLGPQATLFDDNSEQVLTHFLSPNP